MSDSASTENWPSPNLQQHQQVQNMLDDFENNSSSSSLNNRELNAVAALSEHREIDHSNQLLGQVAGLLLNADNADIVLLVEGERLPAHRIILAIRSTYFSAMLYGGMRESVEREITLEDTPLQAFKTLLNYIYTAKLQLNSLALDLVLDLLALVHRYGFTELETAIPEYLKSILNNRIVCQVYATSFMYSIESLMNACLEYIDNFALEILTTKGFLQLSANALTGIISRNSFCAPEIDIFNAVRRWIKAHPEEPQAHALVLANVRFSLVKLSDLLGTVRPSGLVPPDQILDTIEMQSTTRNSDLNYRGFILPNTNVATATNAKVITGDYKTALFATNGIEGGGAVVVGNPASHMLGGERNYTRHSINPRDTSGITIELSRLFILNNIQLHLLDRDQRAYSYYIEISVDRSDWIRVVDRTTFYCRGYQDLYFQERVVKFIRIVGTQATLPGPFHLVNLQAMYSTELFQLDPHSTLQIPHYNVATPKNNAFVIEGVSRSRNALLNGDTKNYDWDDGYTCHQIGAGAIQIQLPQPYLLDSMRLLLWDCDDRVYSYYVEVSCDQLDWKKVAEREQQRSWQTINFERMPVIFIKIVGTYNSANEVFHCVHFETPTEIAFELETDGEKEFAGENSLVKNNAQPKMKVSGLFGGASENANKLLATPPHNSTRSQSFSGGVSAEQQLKKEAALTKSGGSSSALFHQVLEQIVDSIDGGQQTRHEGSSSSSSSSPNNQEIGEKQKQLEWENVGAPSSSSSIAEEGEDRPENSVFTDDGVQEQGNMENLD